MTSNLDSPFKTEMNRRWFNLSQLEKSYDQFVQAKANLLKLAEFSNSEITEFVLSTQVQDVFSNSFVSSIAKIDERSFSEDILSQKTENIINEELERLETQILAFENKIKQKEKQTVSLMKIENQFQDLSLDIERKQLFFEALKDR